MTHKCTYGTHMTPKCLGATAPRFVEGTGALPRAKLGDFDLSRRSPADLGFKWYVHWVCRIPIGNSAQWASAKCRVTGSGSRFLYKTEHVMGGSLRWMAPEIATGAARLREQIGHPVAQAAQVIDGYFPDLYDLSLFHEKLECTRTTNNNYSKVPLYLHHFRWLTSGHDRSPCWSQEHLYCPWLEMLGVTLCPMEPQHIARTSEISNTPRIFQEDKSYSRCYPSFVEANICRKIPIFGGRKSRFLSISGPARLMSSRWAPWWVRPWVLLWPWRLKTRKEDMDFPWFP